MTQALLLVAMIGALFLISHLQLGYDATYQIAYGALSLMGAMISLTFLWLWARRATPLALGMSFSWAGAASVLGWWWIYNLLEQPGAMFESQFLFLFLSFYFAGAVLHFVVIQRSLGTAHFLFSVPILTAIALSVLIRLVF